MDVSPKLRGGLRAFAHTQGPLDPVEWSFMRRHPLIGERILLEAPALRPVARLVRSSHERWDGGYPDGLRGDETHLERGLWGFVTRSTR